MMIQLRLIVLISFMLLINASCKDLSLVEQTYTISITNNSDENISPYLAYGGWGFESEGFHPVYPDTTLPTARPHLPILKPGRTYNYNAIKEWRKLISETPYDTISLFILRSNIYQDSSWNSIQENDLYISRHDIGVEDIEEDELLSIVHN